MQITSRDDNLKPVNPYFAASEKAFAALRPSQSRKKPIKRAAGIESTVCFTQTFMAGPWMSGIRNPCEEQHIENEQELGSNPLFHFPQNEHSTIDPILK